MALIGFPPRSPEDWDRPAAEVEADAERLIARKRVEERARRLRYLLDHPQEFAHPADDAHLLLQRLLLHDATPDSAFPPFRVDLTKQPKGAL